jgi:hypothetical protein
MDESVAVLSDGAELIYPPRTIGGCADLIRENGWSGAMLVEKGAA